MRSFFKLSYVIIVHYELSVTNYVWFTVHDQAFTILFSIAAANRGLQTIKILSIQHFRKQKSGEFIATKSHARITKTLFLFHDSKGLVSFSSSLSSPLLPDDWMLVIAIAA